MRYRKEVILMIKKQKQTLIISLLLSIFAVFILSPTFVLAEGGADVSTVSKINDKATQGVLNTNEESGKVTMSDIDGSSYIPDTDISDANNWVSEKGEDLVGLGATIAEPVAVLFFMVGLAIALLGAATKSKHMAKGLVVMGFAIIAYVGAVFAPEIVHYFSTWLSS